MDELERFTVLRVLEEAERASDGPGSGLMDRTDFQEVIVQLVGLTRQLLKKCDAYEAERDELLAQLNHPPLGPAEVPRGLAADLHPDHTDGVEPAHAFPFGPSRA